MSDVGLHRQVDAQFVHTERSVRMARKKAVQSRVRWNDQEKQSLIEAGRALLTKNPGARLLAVVHSAQDVLSADRRRTILQIGQVPWFKAGLRGMGVPTSSQRGRPPATPAAPVEAWS